MEKVRGSPVGTSGHLNILIYNNPKSRDYSGVVLAIARYDWPLSKWASLQQLNLILAFDFFDHQILYMCWTSYIREKLCHGKK